MSLLDAILQSQDQSAVQQLGSEFGLSEEQTTSALSALVPALAAGMQQNTQRPDGLGGLMAALAGGNHQRYIDDPSTLGQPATVDDGNGILGHVFGSRVVSRDVAARASAETGIGADILKKDAADGRRAGHGRDGARQATRGRTPDAGPMGGGLAPGGGGGAGDLINMITGTLGQASRGGQGSMVTDVIGMLGRALGR